MKLTFAWLCGALLSAIAGCGGGGAGSGATLGASSSGPNVATMIVNSGPAGTVNTPFVSVTVCVPGTSTCQTVDNVLVDTASTGLRILASQLGSLTLPSASDSKGDPLAECQLFADGFVWGTVNLADVKIASEQASALPIHVVVDPNTAPSVPAGCSSGAGAREYSTQTLGANGILGVSVFREDCGANCANNAIAQAYYACPAAGCVAAAVASTQQIQNPVWKFPTDNNGVILELPSVDAAGATGARGSLTFGIGTQSNNALGNATVLTVNSTTGDFTTLFQNATLTYSFIDSGSNALFFPSSMTQCAGATGFYCPASAQALSAVNQSGGIVSTVNFTVANANALLNNNANFWAFSNLAGPNPLNTSFDWGLPFFYGRRVFIAIDGQSTAAGPGPFVAY